MSYGKPCIRNTGAPSAGPASWYATSSTPARVRRKGCMGVSGVAMPAILLQTEGRFGSRHRAQHVLGRGRRGHSHGRIGLLAAPCRCDGVADRLPHADRQHERRLADGLAAADVVLAIGFVPQLDLEVLGHVARRGDLVGARRMRGEQALVVPYQLLGREPAHALDETAFDLADAGGWVL